MLELLISSRRSKSYWTKGKDFSFGGGATNFNFHFFFLDNFASLDGLYMSIGNVGFTKHSLGYSYHRASDFSSLLSKKLSLLSFKASLELLFISNKISLKA